MYQLRKKIFLEHAVHIKVLLPTDAQNKCFKKILKFTLKQLQHISVLSPSSGSVQFELAKVTFVKTSPFIYIGVVNLVVWLHVLSSPCWCVSAALYGTLAVSRCKVRL